MLSTDPCTLSPLSTPGYLSRTDSGPEAGKKKDTNYGIIASLRVKASWDGGDGTVLFLWSVTLTGLLPDALVCTGMCVNRISQVLGHNDHLYLKLPKGIRNWQSFLALFMASQAIFILIFPNTAFDLGLTGVSNVSNPVASQYYAGTMLALAFLLWKFVSMNDKAVSRAVQTAALIHFTLLFLVDILYALRNDGLSILFDTLTLTICAIRLAVVLLCMFYLGRLGAATSGLRKSPSYKDLIENSRKD
ncbi:unnamed protein product [Allacma fusca]|uniref:Tumor protein p53-inducible protein 11 n=1 Tax=Allacma fusca TaxID=39272 RepID=A0A8J2LJ52_9HEXA|nr:unnamed protein product [Allacma fusca]